MNMRRRLMLLTFRITGHFSLFFARLYLGYITKALLAGSDKAALETLKTSTVWPRWPLYEASPASFGCWQRHPFQLSQKTLLVFALDLSEQKLDKVWNVKTLEIEFGYFQKVNKSVLCTKAANRLLLFRYLHKNWTQQVFLLIAKIDIWEEACFLATLLGV